MMRGDERFSSEEASRFTFNVDEKKEMKNGETMLEYMRKAMREFPHIRPIVLMLGLEACKLSPEDDAQRALEAQQKNQTEMQAEIMKQKRAEASALVGEDHLWFLNAWFKDSSETSPARIGEITTREGVLPPDFLQQFLQTFPKGWIDGEISSIGQTDETFPVNEGYGLAINEVAAGRFTRRDHAITFSIDSKSEMNFWMLDAGLPHEMGHANDWESDSALSPEQRLDLLLSIGDRLGDTDRFFPVMWSLFKMKILKCNVITRR